MALSRTLLPLGFLVLAACASSTERDPFVTPDQQQPGTNTGETPAPGTGGGLNTNDPPPVEPEREDVHEVFGHSADVLYRLEPATKAVTVIGNFKNCEPVIDIALDEKSTLFAVSEDTLYTVDKATAQCTKIRTGKFPNSLSFVPKGTIDPDHEALVGYDLGDYVRIDTDTGARTVLGKLGGSYISSGDIVSVKGGKTFLTVKGGTDCKTTDCLVEVDPANGKLLKNWGSIEHARVYGLSFWGGKVYGFDADGNLFEVTFGTNKIVTTTIPIPQKPSGLSFWGAGSSTSAPLVSDPQ